MPREESRLITRQELTALVSCAVNLILTSAKFVLFYAFVKSVSLKAEAWHSLSDIGSSFVVFLALRWGRRQVEQAAEPEPESEEAAEKPGGIFSPPETPAEQPKPVRRAKPEDIVAIGIACLFIVVCIGIFVEIIQPQKIETDYALAVAAGMLAMAYASYLLYRFEYHVGVESDSAGLIADGHHSKIDMYGSILVAIALVCQKLGLAWADRIIAGLICLGMLGHAVEVLAVAARHYLGRSAAEKRDHDHERAHDHAAAIADVYALTGKWGERVSEVLTQVFARILFVKRAERDLGRRVARRVVTLTILALAMLYLLSGLYVCGPDQQAFVERFGKPTTETPYGPGLHYGLPWPVDRVVKARVGRIQTFHLGILTDKPDQPILWTNRHAADEFRCLTGDGNFMTTFVTVHFRIGNLYNALYCCSDPVSLLANATARKMREFAGQNRFFDCLTTRRRAIEEEMHATLSTTMKEFGVEILAVAVRDMHPPIEVAPSFEAVISAMEEKEAAINRAKAYEVGAVPLAEGRAADITAQAEAYKNRVIEDAEARTSAFKALQRQYVVARDVTRIRMYLEMIESTLARTNKWVVLDERLAAPFELWFPKGDTFWRWGIGPSGPGDAPK